MSTCLYILAFNVDFEMMLSKTMSSILSNRTKRPEMSKNLLLKRALIDAILFQRNITEYLMISSISTKSRENDHLFILQYNKEIGRDHVRSTIFDYGL